MAFYKHYVQFDEVVTSSNQLKSAVIMDFSFILKAKSQISTFGRRRIAATGNRAQKYTINTEPIRGIVRFPENGKPQKPILRETYKKMCGR